MRRWYLSTRSRLGIALVAASLVSVGLFLLGAWRNESWLWNYFVWNLFLAWLPLGLMLYLEKVLRRKVWSSWQALGITGLLVVFLPNAFYMTTDIIHVQEVARVDLLSDVVMLSSFICNAFVIGLLTLSLLHGELRKRVSERAGWFIMSGVLLTVSFAIYIGRDLRWSSWDIALNPTSVLFDVSDRLLNIGAHPELFYVTLSFFLFLLSVYAVIWYVARVLRRQQRR
jgi:uncharacterized membrane protein